jgi:HemY protein
VRALVWVLAILALAVALTLAAKYNAGYALLVYPPYRVELSLNLLILLLVAAFVGVYGLVRLATHTLRLPAYVHAFREERRRAKGREAMADALLALFEGRYAKAEKFASTAMELGESPLVAALVAARAAHELKNDDRRDGYLAYAERIAPEQPEARLLTQAEMYVDQRRFAEALAALKTLQAVTRKNLEALRLELKAQLMAKNWDQVLELLAQLEKREAIDATYAAQLRINAHLENLGRKGGDSAALREYWQKIPAREQLNPKIARTAARHFLALGECQTAMEIVTESLEHQWDSDLVKLYGECFGRDVLKQIDRAENWLRSHPRDAALLLTLGRLCMMRELWGKAQSYLEASLAVEPSMEAHHALAQLLEKIGRPEEACDHYRQGVSLLAGG